MDKVHKMFDPSQPGTSTTHLSTDWDKCALCQQDTSELLHCPADSKRATHGIGYTSIADSIASFIDIGCLPKTINVSYLRDDENTEVIFTCNKAKFHDSCRLSLNKTQLHRAKKRKSTVENNTRISSKYTRQTVDQVLGENVTCFFCDLPSPLKSLRHASTKEISEHVKQCAIELQDSRILTKLSICDMVAQDAKYHVKCLVSFYNKSRGKQIKNKSDLDSINHEIAFTEVLSYIEEASLNSTVAPIFRMKDLATLYTDKLKDLGAVITGRVHTTQLKDRVIDAMPELTAHKKGRDVVLVRNTDVGSALEKACEQDDKSESASLATAANIVRRDMLTLKSKFTGFGGRGKRTAWETWKAYGEVTPAFCALASAPESIDDWIQPLERFVILLYDRTSGLSNVNEARKQLFTKKSRTLENIPPTKAALIQHTRRAAYQAGHCWHQMMIADPVLPSPNDWGWKMGSNEWELFWTTQPEATKACRDLLRCSCKKGCRGQCKCNKAALPCTALCQCGGECKRC